MLHKHPEVAHQYIESFHCHCTHSSLWLFCFNRYWYQI